ncbi:MAG: hypothetical protein ACREH9_01500, partial [Pseudomonadota bacterium]
MDWVFSMFSESGLLALLYDFRAISTLQAPSPAFAGTISDMTTRDDDLNVHPGRIRHGNQSANRSKSFVGEVMRAAKKAGHTGKTFGRS